MANLTASAAASGPEVYDLLILVDATYSMYNYLESLQTSLPKVIAISKLTNCFSRVGLLAYRDWTESGRSKNGMLEWSGWLEDNDGKDEEDMLMKMAAGLEPIGGGDIPEATKTGLARAHELMREDATTIVLLYTDAPPHCWMVTETEPGSNYAREQKALSDPASYGGFGPQFADWVSAATLLREGSRKAQVFCFLDNSIATSAVDAGYYVYLSTATYGQCLYMTDSKPHSIAQVTTDVLLAWMGAGKMGVDNYSIPAQLVRYQKGDNIKKIGDEKDPLANSFFWSGQGDSEKSTTSTYRLGASHETKRVARLAQSKYLAEEQMRENIISKDADIDLLRKYLPKKKTLVTDFTKRYAVDEQFKQLVVDRLLSIIETDVTSMALNPVFGALWRAVSSDRQNPARPQLITAFGLQVDRIVDADEKLRMKIWLEESYDYAAEILETLEAIPEVDRFPCVFLDPTIEFSKARVKGEKVDDNEDVNNQSITAFRRDELLEIGRSCDGRILGRLGKVLTRLTYVESAAELPAHIAATTDAEVPKIPIVLASAKHGWMFWKTLLHVVLPGTMLASRPAVLLAALAIRIGLKPLFGAASAAMLFWRDKWNDLEIPETWNSSCLALLLDADAEYRKQMGDSNKKGGGLLLNSDRELFSRLVAYQHAGANLLTTLSAEVGWTPEKARSPIGPVVVCRGCRFPRSVTVMAEKSGGRCGLCVFDNFQDAEHKKRVQEAHVSKEDTASTNATWVECTVRSCRAQYICYNPEDLNVRPKCHYCRLQGSLSQKNPVESKAPTLECVKCLNRVIFPQEYRTSAMTPFHCPACVGDRKTITSISTNASELTKENGLDWLLENKQNTIAEPFKRSVFHTISKASIAEFLANVTILPSLTPEPVLTLKGKTIQNQTALKSNLNSWIHSRTSEKTSCSLCFSTFHPSRLLPACRRHGCHQSICEGCLKGWYGLNSAGSIINTAALFCPFCRRPPAARTLAAYGMGIHAVGRLRAAVEERGQWVHAWCSSCGNAHRYMERECARGAPEPITNWTCEDCDLAAVERARIEEEEAQAALEAANRLDAEMYAQAAARLEAAQRTQRELQIPVKECPGCKTPTLKITGCNHITCVIRQCHTHWCWECGKQFSSSTIYAHMSKAHGSYYGADEMDDDDNYMSE